MFKEYVRSDEYLITALLYLPKDMDVKTVSFKPSDSIVVGLDGLNEAGYRIFCVMLNRELNAELTNTLSCTRTTAWTQSSTAPSWTLTS